jgi:hypothetical protein
MSGFFVIHNATLKILNLILRRRCMQYATYIKFEHSANGKFMISYLHTLRIVTIDLVYSNNIGFMNTQKLIEWK